MKTLSANSLQQNIVLVSLVVVLLTLLSSSFAQNCNLDLMEPRSPDESALFIDPCEEIKVVEITEIDVNAQAQGAHRVKQLRARYGLMGRGITVGVWDDGYVLPSHVEFGGRVTINYLNNLRHEDTPIGSHATHVAGTIGSSGIVPAAQGMAPEATMISFDRRILRKTDEVAAHPGITVSNHSYGPFGGWNYGKIRGCFYDWQWLGRIGESESVIFGRYSQESQTFDQLAQNYPNHTFFVAAGNERDWPADPQTASSHATFNGNYCVMTIITDVKNFQSTTHGLFPSDRQDNGGFDTLTGNAVAKNVVTVGSMADLAIQCNHPDLEDCHLDLSGRTINEIVSDFSSWGPTDDLRVKPDLIANGDTLYSTVLKPECVSIDGSPICSLTAIESDGRYYRDDRGRSSGTSMATPVVTGVAALLNELALRYFNRPLFSDEMKAVLIHSALELRPDGGPTYQAGWGILRADIAGDIVSKNIARMERLPLSKNNTPVVIPVTWPAHSQDFSPRMTLVWLDDASNVENINNYLLDDPTPKLVHNLDMKLISPSGRIYYPWRFTSDANQPRNDSPNKVDNVERIDIPSTNYEEGGWQIVIDTSELRKDSINAALVIDTFVR